MTVGLVVVKGDPNQVELVVIVLGSLLSAFGVLFFLQERDWRREDAQAGSDHSTKR